MAYERPIAAVKRHEQVEQLALLYRNLFHARYHAFPELTSLDKAVLHWINEAQGFVGATNLLSLFFDIEDPYFLRRGHALLVFKKEINTVLSRSGAKQTKKSGLRPPIWITRASCDKCYDVFETTCDANKMGSDDKYYCEKCEVVNGEA